MKKICILILMLIIPINVYAAEIIQNVSSKILCPQVKIADGSVLTTGTVNLNIQRASDAYYWTGSAWQVGSSNLAMTHQHDGVWTYTTTLDTAGDMWITCQDSGGLAYRISWSQTVYAANRFNDNTDTVDVGKWSGTNVATPDTVGYPKVTIKDGTGVGEIDTLSGSIVNVDLSDTCTAVTNDVGITQAGADKAWSTATRVLTAGTNIVLAKGTGVTGFNDIAVSDNIGINWGDISNPTTTQNLSGTSILDFSSIAVEPSYTSFDSSVSTMTAYRPQDKIIVGEDGSLLMITQRGTQGSAGQQYLVLLRSTDDGKTWSFFSQLNSASTSVSGTLLKQSNGDVHIAYGIISDGGSTAFDVYYRKLTWTGTTWTVGSEITVYNSTLSTTGGSKVSLAQDSDNDLWISFQSFTSPNYIVNVYYSSDGVTWNDTTQSFGTSSTTNKFSRIHAFDFNKIGIIVMDDTYITWQYRNDSDGYTAAWSSATNLGNRENSPINSHLASFTDVKGDIHVAFQSGTTSPPNVLYYKRYINGAWESTEQIDSDNNAGYPDVTVTSSGNILYTYNISATMLVRHKRDGASIWEPRQSLFTGTSSTNERLSLIKHAHTKNYIPIQFQQESASPFKLWFGKLYLDKGKGDNITLADNAITSTKIAPDAIGSSEMASGAIVAGTEATGFSTHSAADVWTSGTRTLSAATNITDTGLAIDLDVNNRAIIDLDNAVNTLSDTQIDDITVGSVTGSVGSVTGLTASNLDVAVSTRATPAQVNNEATNALNTYDPPTRTELTTDKDSIITEINANETKIDAIDNFLDTEIALIITETQGIAIIIDSTNTSASAAMVIDTASAGVITADNQYVGKALHCHNEIRLIDSTDQNITDTITIERANPFNIAPGNGSDETCYIK